MKSGRNAKVLTFPTAIQKKTDCPSLKDITIEQSPNHKESKEYWPTILGVVIGLLYVSFLFFA